MGAAEFMDRFEAAQDWEESSEVEEASARLRARNGARPASSPWSGQGNAVGHSWPQGRPEFLDAPPEDHTETIRRQALRIGELTEEVMAYQTGRAYEVGYEHGRLAGLKHAAEEQTPAAPLELKIGSIVRRYHTMDWRPGQSALVIGRLTGGTVRVFIDYETCEHWSPLFFEVIA